MFALSGGGGGGGGRPHMGGRPGGGGGMRGGGRGPGMGPGAGGRGVGGRRPGGAGAGPGGWGGGPGHHHHHGGHGGHGWGGPGWWGGGWGGYPYGYGGGYGYGYDVPYLLVDDDWCTRLVNDRDTIALRDAPPTPRAALAAARAGQFAPRCAASCQAVLELRGGVWCLVYYGGDCYGVSPDTFMGLPVLYETQPSLAGYFDDLRSNRMKQVGIAVAAAALAYVGYRFAKKR